MTIVEITPQQARERQKQGAVLIDVRETGEHALGTPADALLHPRAELERDPGTIVAGKEVELLLICGSGKRSLVAAQALAAQGYVRVASVAGGFQAWQSAGLPISSHHDADFLERYSRHLRLPQVGAEGQQQLQRGGNMPA